MVFAILSYKTFKTDSLLENMKEKNCFQANTLYAKW